MAKSPHEQSFFDEYSALFTHLYRFIHVRIPSATEAEDVTSELFLEAYRSLKRFNPDKGNFEQWLIGIAKLRIIDHWRKRRYEMVDDNFPTPPQNLDGLDARLLFEKMMDELPSEQRSLIIMKFVDGYTHEEIARMTRRKPDAVRKTFSRLIDHLRKTFGDHWQD